MPGPFISFGEMRPNAQLYCAPLCAGVFGVSTGGAGVAGAGAVAGGAMVVGGAIRVAAGGVMSFDAVLVPICPGW